MPASYRICLAWPENNPHAACFREIGLLLVSTLKSLGCTCDLALNQLDPNRINIILGYHLFRFEESFKNSRYIPYQFEQLDSREFPFNSNMESILKHAVETWDYSTKNMAFLNRRGIHAKLLLPGYHRNLELIKRSPLPNREIDILFYGSIGERRKHILDELSRHCTVKVLFGVYGEKRDDWIGKSKIILNVHHYSQQLFEAVRVSYLLNNGCVVISEDSDDYCYDKVGLTRVPYESIVDTCLNFLKDAPGMESTAEQNYREFKTHYAMTDLVKPVLMGDTL